MNPDSINEDDTHVSDMEFIGDDVLADWPLTSIADRFTFDESLGKGGQGTVLKARDVHLKRTVAIKRIHNAQSPQMLRRFYAEAEGLASLNSPYIVSIHDFGRDNDGPYLVLEYVDGDNLATVLDLRGPLGQKDCVELAIKLCDALQHAHDAGVIHRDIKPSNILLSNSGIPLLTDFGLARTQNTNGETGRPPGTEGFIAPEIYSGLAADARSDLWSFGQTLYQLITNQLPHHPNFDLIPDGLREIIRQLVAEDPCHRYQTATELRSALQRVRAGESIDPYDLPTLRMSGGANVVVGSGQLLSCQVANPSTHSVHYTLEVDSPELELHRRFKNELREGETTTHSLPFAPQHYGVFRLSFVMKTKERGVLGGEASISVANRAEEQAGEHHDNLPIALRWRKSLKFSNSIVNKTFDALTLTVYQDRKLSQNICLFGRESVSFGKSHSADIVLRLLPESDENEVIWGQISRVHATCQFNHHGIEWQNQNCSNGTDVDGEFLAANAVKQIRNGSSFSPSGVMDLDCTLFETPSEFKKKTTTSWITSPSRHRQEQHSVYVETMMSRLLNPTFSVTALC